MVNFDNVDISPDNFDTSYYPISTYFLNKQGLLDSIHYYPNDSPYSKRDIFIYDAQGALIETKSILKNGTVQERTLVIKTPDKELLYLATWQNDKIQTEIYSSLDSIILMKIQHRSFFPKHSYFTYKYDLEKDLETETWHYGDSISHMESKQWISKNGIPDSLVFKELADESGTMKLKSYKLKVNEKGEVLNKLNGRFDDPFMSDNFFSRHQRFKGIPSLQLALFTENELITEKQVSYPETFDGTSRIISYQFLYE